MIVPRFARTAKAAALAGLILASPAAADENADAELAAALRGGGYTLYFRHAATDWTQDDHVEQPGDWRSCDPTRARQLSEAGRAEARRVGRAIRRLGIPIGEVLSSEYCRAAETARLLALGPVKTTPDIMNLRAADLAGGREAVVERARRKLAKPPRAGTNTVIVGHGNLMRAATGAYTGEGGAGVFAAGPSGEIRIVALLTPDDWIRLAHLYGDAIPASPPGRR